MLATVAAPLITNRQDLKQGVDDAAGTYRRNEYHPACSQEAGGSKAGGSKAGGQAHDDQAHDGQAGRGQGRREEANRGEDHRRQAGCEDDRGKVVCGEERSCEAGRGQGRREHSREHREADSQGRFRQACARKVEHRQVLSGKAGDFEVGDRQASRRQERHVGIGRRAGIGC